MGPPPLRSALVLFPLPGAPGPARLPRGHDPDGAAFCLGSALRHRWRATPLPALPPTRCPQRRACAASVLLLTFLFSLARAGWEVILLLSNGAGAFASTLAAANVSPNGVGGLFAMAYIFFAGIAMIGEALPTCSAACVERRMRASAHPLPAWATAPLIRLQRSPLSRRTALARAVMVFALEGNMSFTFALCWGLGGIVQQNAEKGGVSFGAGVVAGIVAVTAIIAYCGRAKAEVPDVAEILTRTLQEAEGESSAAERTPLTSNADRAHLKLMGEAVSDPEGWNFVRDPARIFGADGRRGFFPGWLICERAVFSCVRLLERLSHAVSACLRAGPAGRRWRSTLRRLAGARRGRRPSTRRGGWGGGRKPTPPRPAMAPAPSRCAAATAAAAAAPCRCRGRRSSPRRCRHRRAPRRRSSRGSVIALAPQAAPCRRLASRAATAPCRGGPCPRRLAPCRC